MYIDIHSHIIPVIDDGARDINTAAEILKMAAENGTTHIVATPHFIAGSVENPSELIDKKCEELKKIAINEEIEIKIHVGAEVFISPEIPELFEKKIICTLNNSAYILVELPMASIPIYMDDVLYSLQLKGLIPIIAHPERNSEIQKKPEILINLVRRGILAQVNSGSITGLYGKKIRNVAIKFIKMGLIQFIASDTHTCRRRSPNLTKAAAIVGKRFGQDIAKQLFFRNGMAVLENGTVPIYIKEGVKV